MNVRILIIRTAMRTNTRLPVKHDNTNKVAWQLSWAKKYQPRGSDITAKCGGI